MKRNLIAATILFLPFFAFGAFAIYKNVNHHRRSKVIVLQQNLWTMRRAIDFYWTDKQQPPQSLKDLVNSGYLRDIPADPFTGSNQTWIIERESQTPGQQSQPGIVDVHSGAAGADAGGKAYNQY